jgi:hypothetical protein
LRPAWRWSGRPVFGSGVGEAAGGNVELAVEITRHTPRRLGVSAAETLSIVQGLRQRADTVATEECRQT